MAGVGVDTSGGEQERQRELKSGWGGGDSGQGCGTAGVGDSAGWELMEQVARLEGRAVAWDLEY